MKLRNLYTILSVMFLMLAVTLIGCGGGGGGSQVSAPTLAVDPTPDPVVPPTIRSDLTAVARVRATGPVPGQRWVDVAVRPVTDATQYWFTATRDDGTIFTGPVNMSVPWWSVALPIYEGFLITVDQQNSIGLPLKVGQQVAVVAKPGDSGVLELRRNMPIAQVPGWTRQHRAIGEVPGTSENPHASKFPPGYPMAADGDDKVLLFTAFHADNTLRFVWNSYVKDDQGRDVWADAQANQGLIGGYTDNIINQTTVANLNGGGNFFFRHLSTAATVSP